MMALDRLRFILSVASSQNPTGLKEAEAELRLMETQPQFHIALLVINLFCNLNYTRFSLSVIGRITRPPQSDLLTVCTRYPSLMVDTETPPSTARFINCQYSLSITNGG